MPPNPPPTTTTRCSAPADVPQRLQHAVQVRGSGLDVEVLALPRPRLRGQHAAAVDVAEVAVGELVSALGVWIGLVVDPEVPAAVRGVAMLIDVRVLLRGRRLMLAPRVAIVQHDVA